MTACKETGGNEVTMRGYSPIYCMTYAQKEQSIENRGVGFVVEHHFEVSIILSIYYAEVVIFLISVYRNLLIKSYRNLVHHVVVNSKRAQTRRL